MSNRQDTDGFLLVGELMDDAERADTQRSETSQPATKSMTDQRIALEQPEGVLYRINERPVELEQLSSGAPREDDSRHRLLRCAARVELGAKIRKRDGLIARELRKTGLDRDEGL